MKRAPWAFAVWAFAAWTLAVALTLTVSAAHAQSFAALTVTPTGAEVVDIATGVTTLPDGGKVVDKERGLTLQSAYIEFVEGEYIATKETTLTGKFGSLSAPELTLDLVKNELRAQGEVVFTSPDLEVRADTLTLFLDADVARLSGRVTSRDPSFETEALLLNLDQPGALLVSPYAFRNGPFTLQQTAAGGLLQLRQDALPDGTYAYNPTTEVEAGLLQTLQPYLP